MTKVIRFVVMLVVVPAVFGLVLMLVWNYAMPDIFGLPSIDYWHALCLFIIGRLLCGGFGMMVIGGLLHTMFHNHHHHHHLHHGHGHISPREAREMWERRWRMRMDGMMQTEADGDDAKE